MLDYEQWLQQPPYSLARDEKRALMMQRLQWLTEHHRANCAPYRAMLDGLGVDVAALNAPEDVPFLPVSLFKTLTLASMPPDEAVKVMTSSGTSLPASIYSLAFKPVGVPFFTAARRMLPVEIVGISSFFFRISA